jgi:type IV pilus assembly protein PilZ
VVDLRKHSRATLSATLVFFPKAGKDSSEARLPGVGKDISVGGMFIETETPSAFGSEVVVVVELPGQKDKLTLPAVVRWTNPQGMGIQFGLLGARETYAITEFTKSEAE